MTFASALVAPLGHDGARAQSPATQKAPEIQQAAKQGSRGDETTRTPPFTDDQLASEPYDPKCRQPKDHDEADLCVQREAVKTAKEAVWWTSIQTYIGVFGLVGVLISLGLAFWAAFESRKGAKASLQSAAQAAETNRITQRLFFADQRPWVTVEVGGPNEANLLQNELFLSLPIHVENIGKSPATDLSVLVLPISIRDVATDVKALVQEHGFSAIRAVNRHFIANAVLFPGKSETIMRSLTHHVPVTGAASEQKSFFVDYVVIVAYSYEADQARYCNVGAYVTAFAKGPALTMFMENIPPERWQTNALPNSACIT